MLVLHSLMVLHDIANLCIEFGVEEIVVGWWNAKWGLLEEGVCGGTLRRIAVHESQPDTKHRKKAFKLTW